MASIQNTPVSQKIRISLMNGDQINVDARAEWKIGHLQSFLYGLTGIRREGMRLLLGSRPLSSSERVCDLDASSLAQGLTMVRQQPQHPKQYDCLVDLVQENKEGDALLGARVSCPSRTSEQRPGTVIDIMIGLRTGIKQYVIQLDDGRKGYLQELAVKGALVRNAIAQNSTAVPESSTSSKRRRIE